MTTETYRYRAYHERLNTCYYVVVKLSKYGPCGLRYPSRKLIGRSELEDGLAGIHAEQARLKSEFLRKLSLVAA